MRRYELSNPPQYIKSRLTARGGKLDQRWVVVLNNMDEYAQSITAYRRQFRITEEAALTILASFSEPVAQGRLDDAIASVKHWKKFSDEGLRARGYVTPKWHESLTQLLDLDRKNSRKRTDRGVAKRVRDGEILEGRHPPDERSVRRLLKKLKNSGAHL